MVIKKLVVILAVFAFCETYGQEESVFRVLVANGQLLLQKEGQKNPVPLKSGAKLNSADQISMTGAGYVGLIHRSGQTLELTQPGTYTTYELVNEIGGNSNLATRYLNFLWDKVYQNLLNTYYYDHDLEQLKKRVAPDKIRILALNPQRLNPAYNNNVQAVWMEHANSDERYIVNVLNLYDKVLASEMVLEPRFEIDFSDHRYTRDEVFVNSKILSLVIYRASDQNIRSWRYGVTPLKPADHEAVGTEVRFYKDVLAPLSKMDQLFFATYYEQKGLLLDALNIYQSLLSQAPDIPEFRKLYAAFLDRNWERTSGRGL